jgi:prenyltransferase beta subunit
VVDLIRVNFLPVPPTFQRFLFHETGREEFLGSLDRWLLELGLKIPERKSIYTSTERELYYELTSRFGLENNYENIIRDLCTLMINDLDDKMSSRTARYQRTFIFSENMTLAIGGFVTIFGLRGIFGGSSEQALALLMTLFAVLLLFLLYLAFHLYGRVEYRYVDSLVSEFYVENNTEDRHRDSQ